MAQNEGSMVSEPVIAPPRHQGALPPQPSIWPTAIGVILIVIGCAGILMYGCGSLITVILPAIVDKASQTAGEMDEATKLQVDLVRRYMPWHISNALVLTLLGVTAIVAGLGVMRRKRKGVAWTRFWAVGRIIWAIPGSYFGYRIMVESIEAVEKASAASGAPMPSFIIWIMELFGPFGVALGIFFVIAMPIFSLIWFWRPKIKAETAQWI